MKQDRLIKHNAKKDYTLQNFYNYVLTIRKFQPDDMFSIIKIAHETLTERYNPTFFNYFYETFPEGFWIAEKHHKPIAFIAGTITDQETAKILMISVKREHRKQNIGRNLLKQFLKETNLRNIKQIELEVRTDNKEAIAFYKKHGFDIIRTIPKFYQNGEDAYLMKKKN